jgi:hypothetical protein
MSESENSRIDRLEKLYLEMQQAIKDLTAQVMFINPALPPEQKPLDYNEESSKED